MVRRHIGGSIIFSGREKVLTTVAVGRLVGRARPVESLRFRASLLTSVSHSCPYVAGGFRDCLLPHMDAHRRRSHLPPASLPPRRTCKWFYGRCCHRCSCGDVVSTLQPSLSDERTSFYRLGSGLGPAATMIKLPPKKVPSAFGFGGQNCRTCVIAFFIVRHTLVQSKHRKWHLRAK